MDIRKGRDVEVDQLAPNFTLEVRMTVGIDAEGMVCYVIHNDAGTVLDQEKILEVVRLIAAW